MGNLANYILARHRQQMPTSQSYFILFLERLNIRQELIGYEVKALRAQEKTR